MGKPGRLQRALRRFAAPTVETEWVEPPQTPPVESAVPIQECEDRQVVRLTGTVATVALAPRADHPALEVELSDGSGAVTLVWLGRRQIPGIDPGQRIAVSGRISCREGRRLMYNPHYELVQSPAAS